MTQGMARERACCPARVVRAPHSRRTANLPERASGGGEGVGGLVPSALLGDPIAPEGAPAVGVGVMYLPVVDELLLRVNHLGPPATPRGDGEGGARQVSRRAIWGSTREPRAARAPPRGGGDRERAPHHFSSISLQMLRARFFSSAAFACSAGVLSTCASGRGGGRVSAELRSHGCEGWPRGCRREALWKCSTRRLLTQRAAPAGST